MSIKISKYNCLCNLGNDIDDIYNKAINGDNTCFAIKNDIIKNKKLRIGEINIDLPEIKNKNYNLRCNKLILACLKNLKTEELITKYGAENIGIVIATTNSGIEEYEISKNIHHSELGNPAEFVKNYFNLKNYYTSVSTACSSGIKAFSIARELLISEYSKAVIVIGVDSLAKVPIFGFNSLEILSETPSIPFSKNRNGINISEGIAAFFVEKDINSGIEIAGIGETTDYYHSTTPDPEAIEAIRAINKALKDANLKEKDIDYINLHGTGTIANDLMEGKAVNKIFKNNPLSSSTKPLTGHCLGAAASVEIALCCKLLEKQGRKVYPHIYDGIYDENIPKINLAKKDNSIKKLENCLCLSFGFGGTNTAIILKKGGNND